MILLVGPATRLSQYVTALPKTYLAEARFGVTTDTDDLEGEVLAESTEWEGLDRQEFERILADSVGPLDQVPPPYSAKKVDGERAHRRARRGEEVVLPPNRVEIHSMELVDWELPIVRFRVRCSSGTYIRALARDFGAEVGVGAHLTALRREEIGSFGVEGAFPADDLEHGSVPERGWISPLGLLAHLRQVDVSDSDVDAVRQGQSIESDEGEFPDGELVTVAREGALVAIGEAREGRVHPRKVIG
jgi:tRNA pseudouridine55 synthase